MRNNYDFVHSDGQKRRGFTNSLKLLLTSLCCTICLLTTQLAQAQSAQSIILDSNNSAIELICGPGTYTYMVQGGNVTDFTISTPPAGITIVENTAENKLEITVDESVLNSTNIDVSATINGNEVVLAPIAFGPFIAFEVGLKCPQKDQAAVTYPFRVLSISCDENVAELVNAQSVTSVEIEWLVDQDGIVDNGNADFQPFNAATDGSLSDNFFGLVFQESRFNNPSQITFVNGGFNTFIAGKFYLGKVKINGQEVQGLEIGVFEDPLDGISFSGFPSDVSLTVCDDPTTPNINEGAEEISGVINVGANASFQAQLVRFDDENDQTAEFIGNPINLNTNVDNNVSFNADKEGLYKIRVSSTSNSCFVDCPGIGVTDDRAYPTDLEGEGKICLCPKDGSSIIINPNDYFSCEGNDCVFTLTDSNDNEITANGDGNFEVDASGTYTLDVRDGSNNCSIEGAEIEVENEFAVTQPSENVTVGCEPISIDASSNYELLCGDATLTFQWLENGTPINGATSSTLGNISNGGTYTLRVSSAVGCFLDIVYTVVEDKVDPDVVSKVEDDKCDDGDGTVSFNLNSYRNQILNTGSVSDFQFRYYATQTDADDELNPLSNTINVNIDTDSPKKVYVVITDKETKCTSQSCITLTVKPIPDAVPILADAKCPIDPTAQNPSAKFNLVDLEPASLPNGATKDGWFSDANCQNEITGADLTAYEANDQAKVYFSYSANDCPRKVEVTLVVRDYEVGDVEVCESATTNGNYIVDLFGVITSDETIGVSWFEDQACNSPLSQSNTDYLVPTSLFSNNTGIIYAKVTFIGDGLECKIPVEIDVIQAQTPEVNITGLSTKVCLGTGITLNGNLTKAGGASNISFTWYLESTSGTELGTGTTLSLSESEVATLSEGDIIVVEAIINDASGACINTTTVTAEIEVEFFDAPNAQDDELFVCQGENFDLTTANVIVNTDNDETVTGYFQDEALTTPINSPSAVSGLTKAYAKVVTENGCEAVGEITLTELPLPTVLDITLDGCEDPTDNTKGTFDLSLISLQDILGNDGTGMESGLSYTSSFEIKRGNEVLSGTEMIAKTDEVKVVLTRTYENGDSDILCTAMKVITLNFNLPTINSITIDPICEENDDSGNAIFDLTSYEAQIKGDASQTIKWFEKNNGVRGAEITSTASFTAQDGTVVCVEVTQVYGTDEVACTNSTDVTLGTKSRDVATVEVVVDEEPQCIADAFTLTANTTNVGNDATFLWEINGTQISADETLTSMEIADGGATLLEESSNSFKVTVGQGTLECGDGESANDEFLVELLPNTRIVEVSDPQIICDNTPQAYPVNLSITATGDNLQYQWASDGNGTLTPNGNTATYTPSASELANGGEVKVTITVVGTCGQKEAVIPINIFNAPTLTLPSFEARSTCEDEQDDQCAADFDLEVLAGLIVSDNDVQIEWFRADNSPIEGNTVRIDDKETLKVKVSKTFENPYDEGEEEITCTSELEVPVKVFKKPDLTEGGLIVKDALCKGTASGQVSISIETENTDGAQNDAYHVAYFKADETPISPNRFQTMITEVNGVATSTLGALFAGEYFAVFTNKATNCSREIPFTIGEPEELKCLAESLISESCLGSSNGSLSIQVGGGVAPYRVDLEGPFGYTSSVNLDTPNGNNEYVADFTDLPAGSYMVHIRDANSDLSGCNIMKNYIIQKGTKLVPTFTIEDVLCPNEATGFFKAVVEGGQKEYTFTLEKVVSGANTPQEVTEPITVPTEDVVNEYDLICGRAYSELPAGEYKFLVEDFNGCSFCKYFTISEPDPIMITGDVSDVVCYEDRDGAIDATITGGTQGANGGYIYRWSSTTFPMFEADTEDISNLDAGEYTLLIIDGNGCKMTKTFDVGGPTEALAISIDETIDVTCFEAMDGGFKATVTGGTEQYTAQLLKGEELIQSFTNLSDGDMPSNYTLAGGSYEFKVTDANGCEASETFEIDEPEELMIIVEVNKPVDCFEDMNGMLDVTVTGGTPDYTYEWTSKTFKGFSADTEDIDHLSAGWYKLKVTDANGCMVMKEIKVKGPRAPFMANVKAQVDASCPTSADGEVSLMLSGGTQKYSASLQKKVDGIFQEIETFSNLKNGEMIEKADLMAGDYKLVAIDKKGCETSVMFTIDAPETNLLVSTTQKADCEQNNGQATFQIQGLDNYAWTLHQGETKIQEGNDQTATLLVDQLGKGSYTFSILGECAPDAVDFDIEENDCKPEMCDENTFTYEMSSCKGKGMNHSIFLAKINKGKNLNLHFEEGYFTVTNRKFAHLYGELKDNKGKKWTLDLKMKAKRKGLKPWKEHYSKNAATKFWRFFAFTKETATLTCENGDVVYLKAYKDYGLQVGDKAAVFCKGKGAGLWFTWHKGKKHGMGDLNVMLDAYCDVYAAEDNYCTKRKGKYTWKFKNYDPCFPVKIYFTDTKRGRKVNRSTTLKAGRTKYLVTYNDEITCHSDIDTRPYTLKADGKQDYCATSNTRSEDEDIYFWDTTSNNSFITKAADGINVYPNPSNGIFSVDLQYPQGVIEVFNAEGIKVYETPYSGGFTQKLDISTLDIGVYLIKVSSGEHSNTEKIIIGK